MATGKTNALGLPRKEEQTKTVTFSGNGQEVTPDTNKVLSKVTINKPSTLVPENVKKDVEIAGVTGSYEGGGSSNLYQYYNAEQGDNVLIATVCARGEIENSVVVTIMKPDNSIIHTFYINAELDGDPVTIMCDGLPDGYKYSVDSSGDWNKYVSMAYNQNSGGTPSYSLQQYATVYTQSSANHQRVIMLCVETAEL